MTSLHRIYGPGKLATLWLPPVRVSVRRRRWFEAWNPATLLPCVMVLLVGLAGCQTSPAKEGREALGDVIYKNAAAAEQLASLQDLMGGLATSADPVVRALTTVMNRVIDRAKINIEGMKKRIGDLGKAFGLLEKERDGFKAELAEREDDFTGPRTWRWLFWFKVIVGGGTLAFIAAVLFIPGFGPFVIRILGPIFSWLLRARKPA